MSKKLIYITLSAIAKSIESTLSTSPCCYCHHIFMLPQQRRRLFLYILKQIRERYTVLIDDTQPSLNYPTLALSPEQCLHIKELTKQGIYHLFPDIYPWNSFCLEQLPCDRVEVEAHVKLEK